MSKFKSKLARRVMAVLLSGAMVMSNMSVTGAGTVYAAELTTTTEEVVSEVEETADTLGEGAGDEGSSSSSEATSDEESSSSSEATSDEESSSSSEAAGDEESSSSSEGAGDEESSSSSEGAGDEESSSNSEGAGDEESSSAIEEASDVEVSTEEASSIEETASEEESSSEESSMEESSTEEESSEDNTSDVTGTTYTFSAKDDLTLPSADKAVLDEGTKLGTDGYFKVALFDGATTADGNGVTGKVVIRTNKAVTTINAVEIEKCASAGVQFTVKGTADATFKVASTGSSNTSAVALIDADGNIVKAAESVLNEGGSEQSDNSFLVYGNQSAASTLTYKGLSEGKYTIVSPTNADYNRGVWLINASVTDSGASSGGVVVVKGDYTFTAKDDLTLPSADKAVLDEGTKLGTDGYFKVALFDGATTADGNGVTGKVVIRTNKAVTAINAVEIEKCASAGVQFTVKGTADATFKVASTGSSNTSAVALIDADGNIVKAAESVLNEGGSEQSDNSFLVYGNQSATSTLTYKGLAKGTYTVVSPTNADYNRGVWLISASVSDTYESETVAAVTTVLDAAKIFTAPIAVGTFSDGEAVSYVNDYFTVLYSSKSKVDAKSYTGANAWEDGYTGGYRINFGTGDASTTQHAIKFTTTQDEGSVTIWWKAGADGRHMQMLDESGKAVQVSKEASLKDASYITKFKLTSKGTYYIGNEGGSNYIFKVSVTDGHEEGPIDWGEVKAPVILSAAQAVDAEGTLMGNVEVKVQAIINEITGCEKITVDMYDAADATEPIATVSSAKETDTDTTVLFTPEASGTYYFVAKAVRASETSTKDSDRFAMTTPFVLPLTTPSITRATNDGKGGVEIAYSETAEAEKYVAKAVPATKNEDGTYTVAADAVPVTAESTETTATITGLTVGQYYAFSVHAVRGTEEGKESEAFYKIVKDVAEQVWDYSSFGESTSTNTDQCGYSGDVNDGEATVWSLGGKGKIVPASTDGVSFLYTKIDKDTNFVLEATAVVDEWTYSNGQEGFGLMVADTVGPHGHGTKFWNNSYMAVATKMEYYWNGSTVLPTSVGAGDDRVRYNMYLGLGSIVRTGVTDEWETEQAAGATIPSKFVSQQLSLEHAAGSKGLPTGDYNIIGNAKTKKSGCIDVDPLTEIRLRIEKNNTGYFITYIDKDGEETTHKFYEDRAIVDKDYANQSLLQIDKDYMYVGFFAARNAKATFKDISFTTSSVDDGGQPEEKPVTYNTPTYTILSASVANTPDYEINFSTNWNGTLSIKDSAGRELVNEAYFDYLSKQQTTVLSGGSYVPVSMLDKFFEYEKDEEGNRISGTEILKADVKAIIPINDDINAASKLAIGGNKFTVTFTPDRSWHLNDDELQMLSSYDTSVQILNVSYRAYGEEGSNIYVAPDGKATGDGTKEAPLDIFTAVKYAQAGQTIVLTKGTYSLKKTLVIERGVDGTADKPIRMIAEPGSYDRTNPFTPSSVVIDFNGIASGMTIAGDYWYFRGFDVTNSSDGDKGIQVSGSHNTLDQINTYYNGNTGVQISRYKGTDIDKSDDWPSYNTILNCTSYLNADSGHEDADGFAAKLTIGDGNVFDGCIAAYNADDGWDFFAKSESGPIGQVIIKNSVAYRNGYMLVDANGNLDVNGTEKAGKGNGNGFKMGGESIKGYHMVVNSYSFYNKAKGIDSNSCPDIQAYNCVSYNNLNYNVAFYTGVAGYTEYRAENLISLRTDDVTPDKDAAKDQLKPVVASGAADLNSYTGASNFYWNAEKNVAENKDGKTVTTDWFKSLEYKGITTVARNANGTINMGDFLAFSDKADASVFAKLEETTNENGAKIYKAVEGTTALPGIGGQASDDANAAVDETKDTTGNIVSGDDEDTVTTDIWTDEELAQLDANGDTLKILLDLDYDSKGRYYTDYTGIAIKPAVRVAYGPNELSTKNYSVSYKNNIKAYELKPGDAGFDEKLAPAVIIKGKGNYSGEYKLYFTINKIDMTSDKVTSADITTVATGKAQKIKPTVTFDGKKLGTKEYTINRVYTLETVKAEDGTETVEEKSYTGSYESAGTYYIELKGADLNFTGTKIVTVKVLSAEEAASKTPMSKVKVDKIPDQVYDGTAHCPAVTVKGLTASSKDAEGNYVAGDYDVAYYNNIDVGVASVVLTGNIDKGYYGTKTVTFKTIAKPFNAKDYAVTVKGTFDGKTYTATTDEEYKNLIVPSTGSAITFGNVVVKVIGNEGSADVKLTEGIDYTVSYRGNAKAGTASIVIKGMGDFRGRLTRSFKITPYEINASNTTVEPIGAQTYSKGGAKPTVIVKVNGKVVSASNYSVSYKNNNKVGTASVSITGKKLLKGSLKDAQTFTISAKNLLVTDATAQDVYYGTAKKSGDTIAYATKLVVKDGRRKLSLNSDYTVTYYESSQFNEKLFDYKTGTAYIYKTNEDGSVEKVAGTPLEKNSKIAYDGANKTIYAVITGGKNGLYTGAAYTSYKVVGKNDVRYAKITKITDVYTYNDGIVSAPKLEVKIQNRHLDNGKYVKDTEYTTLKLNEDYQIVNIKNNDRFGTATITIQGMGYYAGTNKVTFKIGKKDLTAWNAYIANTVVEDIVVDVNEADVVEGGKYYEEYAEKQFGGVIDFDDVTFVTGKDEAGKDITATEASPLAKAVVGKIYTVGTKTSGALTYGTDYTATEYSNNVITSMTFDEDGYAYQTATVTIKGAGSYTGSKTITFTIRVKKTTAAE